MPDQILTRWYPRRNCPNCDGSGFIASISERGNRIVRKCSCWWLWTNAPAEPGREVRDGKLSAVGSE